MSTKNNHLSGRGWINFFYWNSFLPHLKPLNIHPRSTYEASEIILIEYFIKLNPKVINFILICYRPYGNKILINEWITNIFAIVSIQSWSNARAFFELFFILFKLKWFKIFYGMRKAYMRKYEWMYETISFFNWRMINLGIVFY